MKQGIRDSIDFHKLISQVQKYKYILLVLLLGVLLLVWPSSKEKEESNTELCRMGEIYFDLEELENRMEQVLSKIDGAGEVSLILTVKGGMECIYAADTEYSEENGSYEEQSKTVLISTGSGTEEAAVIQRIYPEFQGALVVCEGGEDPVVRLLITQAVAALTGLKTDKITVCR